MFIDDLSFDGEYPGVSGDPGAEAAERAFEQWNQLERQRHAREAKLDDIRTTTIAKMNHVLKRLEELNQDVTHLVLENESEACLKLLQQRLQNAESYAGIISKNLQEAANG